MRPLRIGVNALYLIPGGVGGTEIYLHELLRALAEIDARNEYFVFTNRETGPDLVPQQPNFHGMPQRVRARFRPARIVWEQTVLPLAAARLGLDALLNPGFTAPVYCGCAAVTVFHDMQHKRHPGHFRRAQPGVRLVIAGLRGFHAAALEKLRTDLGLTGAVEFTGWIPRKQLYDLYRRAWAFVYPSTFEGFGMPVLEALAAGIPTGCSNIEPLSAIAGEAALQFEPGNVEAIYSAMARLAADEPLRARLATEGPRRAAAFSWTATAHATLDAIEDAIRVSP